LEIEIIKNQPLELETIIKNPMKSDLLPVLMLRIRGFGKKSPATSEGREISPLGNPHSQHIEA